MVSRSRALRSGWLVGAVLGSVTCGGGAKLGAGADAAPGGGTDTSPGGGVDTSPGGGMDTSPGGGVDRSPGGGADTSPGGGADTTPLAASCRRPFFPADAPWNRRAVGMAVDAKSDAIIAALQAHGWGAGRMQIDTSIHVMCDAAGTAPKMAFQATGDSYAPDCDLAPVPIPPGGHLEGETGYDCTSDGDCHLIVVAPKEHRLYEQWRVDFSSGKYEGGCLAIWDTSATPPPSGRGDGCTSADAGGFPMAALLFDADEVAAGHIDHAIRFILPNDIIEDGTFVHPATHATTHTAAANAVPYGAHLRLRDARLAAVLAGLPNAAARVVAQALHDYGMFLSDGGNIALTSEDDETTTAKWDTVMGKGLGPRDLQTIMPSDFEMVDGGTRYDVSTTSCSRTPLTQ
jgi:hypothetical protein